MGDFGVEVPPDVQSELGRGAGSLEWQQPNGVPLSRWKIAVGK